MLALVRAGGGRASVRAGTGRKSFLRVWRSGGVEISGSEDHGGWRIGRWSSQS